MTETGIQIWMTLRLAVVRSRQVRQCLDTTPRDSIQSPTSSSLYHYGVSSLDTQREVQLANGLIDPNYPEDKRELMILDSSSLDDADVFSIKEVEDSPYPEVRAAVYNYDEDVPVNIFCA
jgi:hypothetical protein